MSAKTVAGLVTAAWVIFIVILISRSQASLDGLALNELGDFLAGVFAPVAFVWLVTAVWIQSAELKEQRTELALTREEFKNQREVMRAQAEEARKQATFIGTQTKILEAGEKRSEWREAENILVAEVDRLVDLIKRPDNPFNFTNNGTHVILVNMSDFEDFEFLGDVTRQIIQQYASKGVEQLNTPIVCSYPSRFMDVQRLLEECLELQNKTSRATQARAASMRLRELADYCDRLGIRSDTPKWPKPPEFPG